MIKNILTFCLIINDVHSDDHQKKKIKDEVRGAIDISELEEKLNFQYTAMMIQTHLEYQKELMPYINWEV